MKRLLKNLLYTILSIVAFIILVFSAASILDIHYGREAHSHERLVKKAGLGGLDYALLEEAIDTISCYPLGDYVQCRYAPSKSGVIFEITPLFRLNCLIISMEFRSNCSRTPY